MYYKSMFLLDYGDFDPTTIQLETPEDCIKAVDKVFPDEAHQIPLFKEIIESIKGLIECNIKSGMTPKDALFEAFNHLNK